MPACCRCRSRCPVGLGAKARYIEQLRRQIVASGAVGIVAPDDLAAYRRTRRPGTTARARRRDGGLRGAAGDAGRAAAAVGRPSSCYVQFSSGSTRQPLGVDIRQDRLMANIDGSIARQELDAGRFRRELAAALSRHGPDRLRAGAAVRASAASTSGAARLRAPADAVAVADLAAPRHHHLQPELRLRPRRPPRRRPDCRPTSTCRAWSIAGIGADMIQARRARTASPTTFAAGGLRRARLPAELRHGRGLRRPELRPPLRRRAGSTTPAASADFVLCGSVLPGHRVEIRDDDGAVAGRARRSAGSSSQGPSVMPGYFGEPEASARGAVRTAGSTPATSATGATARSSSPAAPRT